MALRLVRQGHIDRPLHFNIVLGVNGGATATPRDLLFLRHSLPEDASYTVTAMGRHQLPLNVMAMAMGGHPRTGFEDNLYYARGVKAESNGQLVARLVRIAKEMNLEIASPDEARQILKMPAQS
jgi:3-keto-5-aminohexanoate cleavage enzyme